MDNAFACWPTASKGRVWSRECFLLNQIQMDMSLPMNKKDKKRLEVLRQKQQKQEKLLAAAKQQTDEPDEIETIEKQIVDIKAEIEKIKNG